MEMRVEHDARDFPHLVLRFVFHDQVVVAQVYRQVVHRRVTSANSEQIKDIIINM